ncbi:hypothetical protein [Streptomyces sp. NBC_01716]|uniref:hypothetical protein n=1 Tax=Streptomyces sp. NBC_01716 TaxID=2975917 RepID=UPI002E3316F3|nr:hypothetical protein [Streptomyces sp. NBC_01716]
MKREPEATDASFITPEVQALADAVRGGVEPEGVERALTAFREACSAAEGAVPRRGRSRRRRDDWRPARRRFPALVSWKAALGAALATATLGGLAVAAVPGGLPDPFRPAEGPAKNSTSTPGVDAPRTPGGTPGATVPSPSSPAPPPSAHDPGSRSHAALCHAWSQGAEKHEGAAFRRLVDAAGGEGAVDGYCAALSGADADAPSAPGKPAGTAAPGQPGQPRNPPAVSPPAASPSRGRSAEHTQDTGKDGS